MIGVISHSVSFEQPFQVHFTGRSATSLGLVPRKIGNTCTGIKVDREQQPYVVRALVGSEIMNAKSYAYTDAFQVQLEKLAVNGFCNPLYALADAANEFLFTIPEVCKAFMAEVSSIILALPELKDVPREQKLARFGPAALERTVMDIIKKTEYGTASMVWDLRAGRPTEVKFINGYWVKRGLEVGVETPLNCDLLSRIEERSKSSR